jgi:hypothetical protein
MRMAGDLGFDVLLAEDACFAFARRDWSGRLRQGLWSSSSAIRLSPSQIRACGFPAPGSSRG